MRRDDSGSVTIWVLGLSLLLLLFGGLALDFWRGLAAQRELSAVADSAAIAAASGIDEEHYRSTGELVLDQARVRSLAAWAVGSQDTDVLLVLVDVSPDGSSVTVTLSSALQLGLLGVFVDQSDPLQVRATATASPRLLP